MDRKIVSTAAVFGIIAIALGAFGAHALKKVLPIEQLLTFETGVRYQMYHSLFLLFVGTTNLINLKSKKVIYNLITMGIILFSGSIYLLATNSLMPVDFKILGFLTPIGGILFIMAWFLLFYNIAFIKKKKIKSDVVIK